MSEIVYSQRISEIEQRTEVSYDARKELTNALREERNNRGPIERQLPGIIPGTLAVLGCLYMVHQNKKNPPVYSSSGNQPNTQIFRGELDDLNSDNWQGRPFG